MKQKKIETIIQKYFNGELEGDELKYLEEHYLDKEIKKYFKKSVELNYFLSSRYEKVDRELAYSQFISGIQKKNEKGESKFGIRKISILKYAAILIGILGVSFFYKDLFLSTEKLIITNEDIVLVLDDGNIEVISEAGEKKIIDASGNVIGTHKGSTISYTPIEENQMDNKKGDVPEKLVYNEIKVPYGKTFQLILSDSTIVNLNAGTSLKYPVKFINGEERMVYVKGEAYFEVTKDLSNPFIVNTGEVNIMVTGTAFNVSCYDEDLNINTVLVEGSVLVYDEKDVNKEEFSTSIIPGELAEWNRDKKEMNVSQVDTDVYTSWQKGVLIFKRMKFSDITVKLERHYNVTIESSNEELNEKIFTARFENDSIEHVLESFRDNFDLVFQIENNQIIIN